MQHLFAIHVNSNGHSIFSITNIRIYKYVCFIFVSCDQMDRIWPCNDIILCCHFLLWPRVYVYEYVRFACDTGRVVLLTVCLSLQLSSQQRCFKHGVLSASCTCLRRRTLLCYVRCLRRPPSFRFWRYTLPFFPLLQFFSAVSISASFVRESSML